MSVSIAAREFSVVLLGDFNPAILHPAWFASTGLIKLSEGDAADVEVVHKEVTIWTSDWLKLNADKNRVQFQSDQEAYAGPLRDVAIGALTLLEHTPVRAVGVNVSAFFQFTSQEQLDKFGHELIPKPRWEKALPEPKTLKAVITSRRDDDYRGNLNLTIAATTRFQFSAYVHINDHNEVEPEAKRPSAISAISIIQRQWDKAIDRIHALHADLTGAF